MCIDDEMLVQIANEVSLLNHAFRSNPNGGEIPGRCVITQGVAALSPEDQMKIVRKVQTFTDFDEENPPYDWHGMGDWHDFGSFDHNGDTIFWKIDIFEDERMELGWEEAADPKDSYRVLTILLASEY